MGPKAASIPLHAADMPTAGRHRPRLRRVGTCALVGLLATRVVAAEPAAPAEPHALAELDLEELMDVEVVTSARKEQRLADVAAAMTVLTSDDLRRMGVTSLPEALRAVPGMMVARVRANTWAVTARGLGDTLANKLLVMIDGRIVYSPLHSGVFWDVQGLFVEDVDRIEVIRGPGGSLWGANAVNGIINVITKSAHDTTGGLLAADVGTSTGLGRLRYGFDVGGGGHVRVDAQHVQIGPAKDGLDPDEEANDRLSMERAGFRADWRGTGGDSFALIGDAYDGDEDERLTEPLLVPPFTRTFDDRMELRGADLILRWERDLGDSSFALQGGYDFTRREDAISGDTLHAFDLDFQHRLALRERHDLVWGLGYRIYRSEFDGSFAFQVAPAERDDDVASAFVQDEIALASGRVRLTFGSKFEINDYSGFEAQPGVRMAFRPRERQMTWVAMSRAVRTPSIVDVDVRLTPVVLPSDPPLAISIVGNDDFRTEQLLAFEAGYRVQPIDRVSVDLAVFRNGYRRLRSGSVGTPFVEVDPAPLHVVVPVNIGNDLRGKTWGAELALNWQPREGWLLQANASVLRVDLSETDINRRDPRSGQWLRSAVDLPRNVSLDVIVRRVGRLAFFDIDGYTEADMRLAWASRDGRLEVAIAGHDLLHASHPEYDEPGKRSEIERAGVVSLEWRF